MFAACTASNKKASVRQFIEGFAAAMNLSNLSDALGNNPGMVLAAILALAGMLTLVMITLGTQAIVHWRIDHESERVIEFKRELIAFGYTPDEIQMIADPSGHQHKGRSRAQRHALRERHAMAQALS